MIRFVAGPDGGWNELQNLLGTADFTPAMVHIEQMNLENQYCCIIPELDGLLIFL